MGDSEATALLDSQRALCSQAFLTHLETQATQPNPTTHRSALSLAATVLRLYVPTAVPPLMHTGGADVLEHQIVQRSTTCCGVSGALSDWTQGEVLEGFVLMILDTDVAELASAVRNYTNTLAVAPAAPRLGTLGHMPPCRVPPTRALSSFCSPSMTLHSKRLSPSAVAASQMGRPSRRCWSSQSLTSTASRRAPRRRGPRPQPPYGRCAPCVCCGDPGEDVAGMTPVSMQMWQG